MTNCHFDLAPCGLQNSATHIRCVEMKTNHLGFGIEITDIDIAGSLSDNEITGVKDAFSEAGVIFIRDQDISETDHIAFAELFGEININRFFQAHPDYPKIAMVVKEPDQRNNIGGGWHTDHSYDLVPALGSMLVARELPETGGDTWYASMYGAYDALSDGLKATLESMNAVHSAHHVFGAKAEREENTDGRIGNPAAADSLTDPVHPVVIKHPLSGRKSLYVNPGFTVRFEGWTEEESAPLLGHLYEVAVREQNIVKFDWQPGSIAFWDNRATWHFAQNDYHGQRRALHRITIEGCELQAAL